jgi:hypothetical protein
VSLGTALRAILPVRARPAGAPGLDRLPDPVPSAYPYPSGARAIGPVESRIANPGRDRARAQLFPPTGNPTQRAQAHQDYAGRAGADMAAARETAGVRREAKPTRRRPWLFSGGSQPAQAAQASPSSTPGGRPCSGC